jgi:hypothetical protein
MSYEGYEQVLCPNGHLWIEDALKAMYEGYDLCSVCKAKPVWCNSVDQTNCDPEVEKEMRVELVLRSPAEINTCKECGHSKLVKEQTYVIPTDKGRKIDFDAPGVFLKEDLEQ